MLPNFPHDWQLQLKFNRNNYSDSQVFLILQIAKYNEKVNSNATARSAEIAKTVCSIVVFPILENTNPPIYTVSNPKITVDIVNKILVLIILNI